LKSSNSSKFNLNEAETDKSGAGKSFHEFDMICGLNNDLLVSVPQKPFAPTKYLRRLTRSQREVTRQSRLKGSRNIEKLIRFFAGTTDCRPDQTVPRSTKNLLSIVKQHQTGFVLTGTHQWCQGRTMPCSACSSCFQPRQSNEFKMIKIQFDICGGVWSFFALPRHNSEIPCCDYVGIRVGEFQHIDSFRSKVLWVIVL
jgi:hypothetical protein